MDGEVAFTLVGSSSGMALHKPPSVRSSGAGMVPEQAHSAGNVTGCTATDFLSLPPNARISVTFALGRDCSSGDPQVRAEGFLALTKL